METDAGFREVQQRIVGEHAIELGQVSSSTEVYAHPRQNIQGTSNTLNFPSISLKTDKEKILDLKQEILSSQGSHQKENENLVDGNKENRASCKTASCNEKEEITETISKVIIHKIDEWLQAEQGRQAINNPVKVVRKNGIQESISTAEAPQAIDRFLEKTFKIWLNLQNNFNSARKQDDEYTIFKVPESTRLHDKRTYEPTIVPIGPYHHVHKRLSFREMEAMKPECINYFVSLDPQERDVESLKLECLSILKTLEHRARSCYSDDTSLMESEHFTEVLFRDSCFIIYLLLHQKEKRDDMEQVNGSVRGTQSCHKERWPLIEMKNLNDVKLDLLKLENQIPFFVIQALFEFIKPYHLPSSDLVDLTLQLFEDFHLLKTKCISMPQIDEVHHVLHLVHMSLGSLTNNQMYSPERWDLELPSRIDVPTWIPSAKELQESGIKFKKKKDPTSILDISFHAGIMELPTLRIHSYITPLMCNLIAFEQCSPQAEAYISSYVSFINCLMHHEEDVRLLHLKGVIINEMATDKKVAEYFRGICPQGPISSKPNYLHDLFIKVTEHHAHKKNRWIAEAKRKYCSSPWVTLSVIAGIVLLLLTFLQTLFTIIQTVNGLKAHGR